MVGHRPACHTRTQQSDILTCAYASHGDTSHILLLPGDPGECFTMAVDAFDIADRYQTPVFVMSDLDIGMNDWVVDALKWDDARKPDRGKLLGTEELEQVETFARYRDVDGDGIPFRTVPGTHPEKGAFFTRGTSHTDTGAYTEDGRIHEQSLERIKRKIAGSAATLPKPVIDDRLSGIAAGNRQLRCHGCRGARRSRTARGSGSCLQSHAPAGVPVCTGSLGVRGTPRLSLCRGTEPRCTDAHLLLAETDIPASKLIALTNIDGMPVTAKFVSDAVLHALLQLPGYEAAHASRISAE